MLVVEPVAAAERRPPRLRPESPPARDPLVEFPLGGSRALSPAVGAGREPQLDGAGLACRDGLSVRAGTFSPRVSRMRPRGEGESGRSADGSRYGPRAGVEARFEHNGVEIARGLELGGVALNHGTVKFEVTEPPLSGVEERGIGRVNGEPRWAAPVGLDPWCWIASVARPVRCGTHICRGS